MKTHAACTKYDNLVRKVGTLYQISYNKRSIICFMLYKEAEREV